MHPCNDSGGGRRNRYRLGGLRAVGQVVTETKDLTSALKPKLNHCADEAISKLLSLKNGRMNGSLAKIDEAGLLEEPGVNAIEEQLGFDGDVDNRPLLGRDLLRSAKVRDQLIPPLVECLTDTGSSIQCPCTVLLKGTFHQAKAVPEITGIGLWA